MVSLLLAHITLMLNRNFSIGGSIKFIQFYSVPLWPHQPNNAGETVSPPASNFNVLNVQRCSYVYFGCSKRLSATVVFLWSQTSLCIFLWPLTSTFFSYVFLFIVFYLVLILDRRKRLLTITLTKFFSATKLTLFPLQARSPLDVPLFLGPFSVNTRAGYDVVKIPADEST